MESTILILYGGDDWNYDTPNFSEGQKFAYNLWGDICESLNISLLRGSIQWFKEGEFQRFWEYTSYGWRKREDTFSPTVIYDKCPDFSHYTPSHPDYSRLEQKKHLATYIPILNYPEMTEILKNKLAQSLIFHSSLPKTHYIPRHIPPSNLITNSSYQVFKALFGTGGKEVEITSDIPQHTDRQIVQQALLPTSQSPRDIRIAFIGDEPEYAYMRKASSHSLYTNISQGATMEFLSLEDVPEIVSHAQRILHPIHSVFPKSILSTDFLLDDNDDILGLVEVNTQPGLQGFESQSELLETHLHNLTDYLLAET